jgi:hypothetical protein
MTASHNCVFTRVICCAYRLSSISRSQKDGSFGASSTERSSLVLFYLVLWTSQLQSLAWTIWYWTLWPWLPLLTSGRSIQALRTTHFPTCESPSTGKSKASWPGWTWVFRVLASQLAWRPYIQAPPHPRGRFSGPGSVRETPEVDSIWCGKSQNMDSLRVESRAPNSRTFGRPTKLTKTSCWASCLTRRLPQTAGPSALQAIMESRQTVLRDHPSERLLFGDLIRHILRLLEVFGKLNSSPRTVGSLWVDKVSEDGNLWISP